MQQVNAGLTAPNLPRAQVDLDPDTAENLRLYGLAFQGNTWARQAMNQSGLPAPMQQIPEWLGRTDQFGLGIAQRNMPTPGTPMGDRFYYGDSETNPFTGDTYNYQGYAEMIAPGGILQKTISNAIMTSPITISEAGIKAMVQLGGTDMMPDFSAGAGRSIFDIQLSMMGENYRNSQFGLAQSFEKLAEQLRVIPRQLDIQERLFEMGVQKQEKQMQLGWNKFLTQWQWGLEDINRNFERGQVKSGWAEAGLNLQVNQQQLQYGWQNEDIEEALRYATGRDRRKLLKQQERGAISYSLSMVGADLQREQIETQRGWSEEDYAIALDRHNQRKGWFQEEFALTQENFREEIALRRELMEINRETTMNDLQRQQASLANAQQHLVFMQQEQGQLMAIQTTLEEMNAQAEYFRNVIPSTNTISPAGLTTSDKYGGDLGSMIRDLMTTIGGGEVYYPTPASGNNKEITEEKIKEMEMLEGEAELRRQLREINTEIAINDVLTHQEELDNSQSLYALAVEFQQVLTTSQTIAEYIQTVRLAEISMTDAYAQAITNLGKAFMSAGNDMASTIANILGVLHGMAAGMIQSKINELTWPTGGPPETPKKVPDKSLAECQANPNQEGCEWYSGSHATGGQITSTGLALVHQGEHVVPQNGALVLREPEVARLLGQILVAIQSANRNGNKVQISVLTNDPKSGLDYGMNLSRELELN